MKAILSWLGMPIAKNFSISRLSLLVVIFCLLLVFLLGAPANFPSGTLITISEGESLSEVSQGLSSQNVVRFQTILSFLVSVSGAGEKVKAGSYVFSEPAPAYVVAYRIVNGLFGVDRVSVRLPEGSTREEMSELLSEKLYRFDPERFLMITEGKEGYLFPDTYFFSPDASAEQVMRSLTDTFDSKVASLRKEAASSTHSFDEIITMASLIERESHDSDDRRLISGVLWNRIEIEMPLQVDAPFFYLLGKGSLELTQEDLEIDSPYNTYKNKGLPPGPIANPGLDSIEAALNPTPSLFLYYLSDATGKTHFAETFDEHKENKRLYLR